MGVREPFPLEPRNLPTTPASRTLIVAGRDARAGAGLDVSGLLSPELPRLLVVASPAQDVELRPDFPARPGPRSSVPTAALVAVSAVPPFFRNVYAVDPHPAPVGGACTMELYYAVSPGKLVAYGLSGGP